MTARISKPTCCSLETWCFVYGVFNCITSGLTLLVTAVGMGNLEAEMERRDGHFRSGHHYMIRDDKYMLQDNIYGVVAVLSIFVFALAEFVFSVLLCYGVNKRKAVFVKAFLAYGIVKIVLVMLAAILYTTSSDFDLAGGTAMVAGCGLYSLILYMVYRTFEAIKMSEIDKYQIMDNKPSKLAEP